MKQIFKIIPILIFTEIFGQNTQCKIPLDSLDLMMNVNDFFIDKIVKDDSLEYFNKSDTITNSILVFEKYGETDHSRKTKLTGYDLKKDYYSQKYDNINIGKLYSISRYSESDKLVCYKNIWFPTFSILSTDDDKFIALIAENSLLNENEFNLFIESLQKTNKLNKILSDNFEIFQFDFNSYYIEFKKGRGSYGKMHYVLFEGDEDIPTVYIEFLIISKLADVNQLKWLNQKNQ